VARYSRHSSLTSAITLPCQQELLTTLQSALSVAITTDELSAVLSAVWSKMFGFKEKKQQKKNQVLAEPSRLV